MSASIEYDGRTLSLLPDESVLDALLRSGISAAHSCKAGTCGSCMMRAVSGDVPDRAQSGLKDSWKTQGYFLPCVCHPVSDLVIGRPGADAQVGAAISGLDLLSGDVMRVRLRCDSPIAFRAGQYVSLVREDCLARSYSIACLPGGAEMELHVRKLKDGRMSGWIHHEARVGQRLSVLGPSGDCFYVPGREDQPLLLAGTGTGLAPLYGIVQDALRQGHRGPIHLFHGARNREGLYLVEELQRLAASHAGVEYTPTVLEASDSTEAVAGPIDHIVLKRLPKLSGWRVFVCGDPAVVQLLKKKFFLAGAASKDIYADAFLPAA